MTNGRIESSSIFSLFILIIFCEVVLLLMYNAHCFLWVDCNNFFGLVLRYFWYDLVIFILRSLLKDDVVASESDKCLSSKFFV